MSRLRNLAIFLGLDPVRTIHVAQALPAFRRDYLKLKAELASNSDFPMGKLYPCLDEKTGDSGVAKGHYFHQDLLVAQRIFQDNPELHVDVGSRIDGFVAHVAVFRRIEVFDIRSLSSTTVNIHFKQLDLMNPAPPEYMNYCDSLSCLHTVEHFGLGRYGDAINANGHILGLKNLWKILKPGGKFYFSVPIGPQRIEFNAQRVFSVVYLHQLLSESFQFDRFSYVDDQGDLHDDVELTPERMRANCGCHYGCGIFELTKLGEITG
jgi:SAM-dependent methyltransferase